MKVCSVCRKKFSSKNGLKQHMQAVHSGNSNGGGKPRQGVMAGYSGRALSKPQVMGSNSGDGTITLQRSELLETIEVVANGTSAKGAIRLLPTANCMKWLHKIASSFDQIVWHSARVYFKPAVGTTFAGSLVIGVDWNPAATDAARDTVQACSPVTESPAWQPSQLVLPTQRLQSRRYYFMVSAVAQDTSPAAVLYNLKCTASTAQTFVGDIWIDYKVSLLSPSA